MENGKKLPVLQDQGAKNRDGEQRARQITDARMGEG
jgi:hypothetical protein